MNQISFTANFIANTKILKKEKFYRPYQKEDATIVELDINDDNDMASLKDTSDSWMNSGGELISDMYDNIFDGYKSPELIKSHYYALTTQKDSFEKLNPAEILGVAEFSEQIGDTNELKYLEVEPTTKYSVKHRKYKCVGKALINFLSNEFPNKPYLVLSSQEAIKFYTKNKFKRYTESDVFISSSY